MLALSRPQLPLGSLNGVRIIGHEQVATGVYRTTYENGMAVLVNYNDNEADVCGVTVLPRSFTLLDEGKSMNKRFRLTVTQKRDMAGYVFALPFILGFTLFSSIRSYSR